MTMEVVNRMSVMALLAFKTADRTLKEINSLALDIIVHFLNIQLRTSP